MLYRHFIALPLALVCLAPVRAQVPPAALDPDADRQALTQGLSATTLPKPPRF